MPNITCYNEFSAHLSACFDEFETPEEFRSYIESIAYDRGHSAGYDEVLSIARGMVWELREPIENFKKRILGER